MASIAMLVRKGEYVSPALLEETQRNYLLNGRFDAPLMVSEHIQFYLR